MLQGTADRDRKHWHLILSANNAVSVSYNNYKSGAIRRVAVEHAVVRGEKGWSAEIAIPYASFGEKYPVDGIQWRMNFMREEQPFKEVSSWSETLNSFHETENFGRIYFGASKRAEIVNVDWNEIFPGRNHLTVTAQNPGSESRKADIQLVLNGKKLAEKSVVLKPGSYAKVEMEYMLNDSAGELALLLDGEKRTMNFSARKLAGQLESDELINPAESISGTLELPVSSYALDGISLQWLLDGKPAASATALRGRIVKFLLQMPESAVGEHTLTVKLLKNGATIDSIDIPFTIVPGLFDEI
jgi:hypothetical protein